LSALYKDENNLTKKKTAAIICGAVAAAAAVFVILYFILIKNTHQNQDFEKLREGMKPWENSLVSGVSVYVPEDYERIENEIYPEFIKYEKGDATISLGAENGHYDLSNYAYLMLEKYSQNTDYFKIKDQYDEQLSSALVHVAKFDYGIRDDSGYTKTYTALVSFTAGDENMFILTCIADAEQYPYYEEDFTRTYRTTAIVPK